MRRLAFSVIGEKQKSVVNVAHVKNQSAVGKRKELTVGVYLHEF
jgi:hypothetical protein